MSIMTWNVSLTHHMDLHRCYACHRYYAVESGELPGRCALCLAEEMSHMRDEIAKRDRSIAALRGVISKRARVDG